MIKRSHIGLSVKLQAALLQLGLDPKTAELDHDPALGLRPFSTVTGDYDPPENDPRYLVWRDSVEHRKKTSGTKATSAGSDVHLIAKSKRIRRKEAVHQTRRLDMQTGTWPMSTDSFADLDRAIEGFVRKRKIPNRPWPNKKHKFANKPRN